MPRRAEDTRNAIWDISFYIERKILSLQFYMKTQCRSHAVLLLITRRFRNSAAIMASNDNITDTTTKRMVEASCPGTCISEKIASGSV